MGEPSTEANAVEPLPPQSPAQEEAPEEPRRTLRSGRILPEPEAGTPRREREATRASSAEDSEAEPLPPQSPAQEEAPEDGKDLRRKQEARERMRTLRAVQKQAEEDAFLTKIVSKLLLGTTLH